MCEPEKACVQRALPTAGCVSCRDFCSIRSLIAPLVNSPNEIDKGTLGERSRISYDMSFLSY